MRFLCAEKKKKKHTPPTWIKWDFLSCVNVREWRGTTRRSAHTHNAQGSSKWQQMKLLRAILARYNATVFFSIFDLISTASSSPFSRTMSRRFFFPLLYSMSVFSTAIGNFFANGYLWILNVVHKCHLAAFYFIGMSPSTRSLRIILCHERSTYDCFVCKWQNRTTGIRSHLGD